MNKYKVNIEVYAEDSLEAFDIVKNKIECCQFEEVGSIECMGKEEDDLIYEEGLYS